MNMLFSYLSLSKIHLFLINLDLRKHFNMRFLPLRTMGDMRKDYVSERFMIISKKADKVIDPKKMPFAPGNESMTNPSVLSLVAKDGMLQRLQDNEDEYVKNCRFEKVYG